MSAPARKLQPPSRSRRWGELLSIGELVRLASGLPLLQTEPRGSQEPVMLLPGLGFTDAALLPLRSYLRSRGYAARGWGLGRNHGNVDRLLPQVVERLRELSDQADEAVRLVGWSLGGVLAREAARHEPSRVARVITLGSPIQGGPKYTVAADIYRRRGYDLDSIEAELAERNARPLPVPVTAIHARRDGVVAWRACIDERPEVENLGVDTTHLGLLLNPRVYRIVARRLAEPAEDLRPRAAA